MKKTIVFFIVISMICVSMTGAFSLIGTQEVEYAEKNIVDPNYISTEEATAQLANTANKYLNAKEDDFKPCDISAETEVNLPWIGKLNKGDLLEWYVRLVYDGKEFFKEVPISIQDFSEKFLKHPQYGETLNFNVDDDPADDVQVIIGFYWSIIMYPDGQEQKSLETRFRVVQINDEIADQQAEFEVWSEIHLNYGLVKEPPKSRNRNSLISNILPQGGYKLGFFIGKLLEFFKNRRTIGFPLLKNIINKINVPSEEKDEPREDDGIGTLDADDDYLSIGAGYRCPEGEQIPLFTEKRFAFAKGIDWKGSYATIFKPTIFQHQMSPGNNVVGDEEIELLYGFRAHEAASDSYKYDIAFNVGFEPAVNLKTKFIPRDGYIYYFWNVPKQDNYGGWTRRSLPTKVSFTAELKTGPSDHEGIPKVTLELDEIQADLAASSSKWFSFDLGILGFEYKASQKFDVGIIVDVPSVFTEKVQIKGVPTSIQCKWGITDLDFFINPGKRFRAGLGVYAQLTMSSNIDKIIVFYPTTDPSAPDSPFLVVDNIPSSQRVTVGGSVDITSGTMLSVDVSASAVLDMSSSVGGITLYYPKANPYDSDTEFITIPGIPNRVSASAHGRLTVDLNNLMNPSNYVYGSVSHTCSSNVAEVNVYIPEADDPFIRFTDIPAHAEIRGELYWAQLRGYGYSSRSSVGNYDPVEINLEYGNYKLYNRLEIKDGTIYTRFHFASDGYFELDTTDKMITNDLRFYDNTPGNEKELLLFVEEVSADDLRASWSFTQTGDSIKINRLNFGGIVDTLKGLHLGLALKSKSVSLDLDWVIGKKGNFMIRVYQDEDVPLHFDLGQPGLYDCLIDITLSQTLSFDADWDWTQGYIENGNVHPGHITINGNTAGPNVKSFSFKFIYQETYGIDVQFTDLEVYLDLEWCKPKPPRILPYVWLEFYVSVSSLDVDLLWPDANGNAQWHYNIEDWLDPHPP